MSVATNQQPLAPPSAGSHVHSGGLEVLQIALDTIQPSKTNPRKSFDAVELDELAQSIASIGLLQPITVRPRSLDCMSGEPLDETTVADCYEIIAGERRFRAVQQLGLGSIPCIVREMTDEQALEAQIVENLQRKDVSALEEANGFLALVDQLAAKGATRTEAVEQVAAKIGKSVRHVWSRMKLLGLDPEAKEALAAGTIEPSHADELVRLPAEQQKVFTKEIAASPKKVSTRELKKKIAATKPAKASKATSFNPKELEPEKPAKHELAVARGFMWAIAWGWAGLDVFDGERCIESLANWYACCDDATREVFDKIATEIGLNPTKVRSEESAKFLASLADPKPVKKVSKVSPSPKVKKAAPVSKSAKSAKSKPAKKSAAKSTGVSKDASTRVGSKSVVTRNATRAKGGR